MYCLEIIFAGKSALQYASNYYLYHLFFIHFENMKNRAIELELIKAAKMENNLKQTSIQNRLRKSSAAWQPAASGQAAAAHKWPFGHSQNTRPLSTASGRETALAEKQTAKKYQVSFRVKAPRPISMSVRSCAYLFSVW